jgi:hypothetical protein
MVETSFSAAGIRERDDLQRLLRTQIEVIAPDTLVITEEFGEWEDSRRRIDLLGLDKDANLVVIELKRSEDGGHMELQAIRYAAMVSTMTFEKVVELYADHLSRLGQSFDASNAILEFLEWDEADEERFAQGFRIILASAEFSKELTTSVMWLNENGLDIRCVRIKPYRDEGRILVDVQQVIPLPEAADYIVKIKEKEVREKISRREQSARGDLYVRFWTSLQQRAAPRTEINKTIMPSDKHWFGGRFEGPGMNFNYVVADDRLRLDLYIFGTRNVRPKTIFDTLHGDKSEIEKRFGQPLGWERLDAKKACRIRHDMPELRMSDEENWIDIQDKLIDAMIRFERALRPSITKVEF